MNTKASVIIPVFDGERTIARALDSVLAQTFGNFEVIIVDDGSLDRTVDLVLEYSDERLQLIRHPQNRGAAAARNTGIKAARSRWIAFLDADDAWTPEKLRRQVDLLERTGAGGSACLTGHIIHKHGSERTVRLNLTSRSFRSNIFFGCTFSPGSTLMVERTVFDKVGLFDEKLLRLEDWDWLLLFVEGHDMQFVREPLALVYLTAKAAPESIHKVPPTLDAIQRMQLKHGSRYPSLLTRMKIKSSLLIELGAAMYRIGRPWTAALYVVAALVVYPLRNLAFYRMLLRSVIERQDRADETST
jgi:glycosyltransferase involved in cell wall biosynthesis